MGRNCVQDRLSFANKSVARITALGEAEPRPLPKLFIEAVKRIKAAGGASFEKQPHRASPRWGSSKERLVAGGGSSRASLFSPVGRVCD